MTGSGLGDQIGQYDRFYLHRQVLLDVLTLLSMSSTIRRTSLQWLQQQQWVEV